MVIELLDVAAGGLDGAIFGHSGMPERSFLSSAVTGVAVGAFANNMTQAAVGGAVGGLLIHAFNSKTRTVGNLAMSVVTTTAIGVVTQILKESWVERRADKKAAALEHSLHAQHQR